MSESRRKYVMHAHALRALLLAAPDGKTAGALGHAIGLSTSGAYAILSNEYGFYVDRWVRLERGAIAAVWCCVPVPEDCPRPDPKTAETQGEPV